MNRRNRVRLATMPAGAVVILVGSRLVESARAYGLFVPPTVDLGEFALPVSILGVWIVLVGSAVLVTGWQRLVGWRRFLSYVTLTGGYGLFAISGYVFALAAPARGQRDLADLFIGMSLGGVVLGLVIARFADVFLEIPSDDPDGGQ